MKFCARHITELGDSVRKRGLWKFVDELNAKRFMVRWLRGSATKDEIDPLVVAMLEITHKANRLGIPMASGVCPLCELARVQEDAELPAKLIEGHVAIAHQLLITNGRCSR